MKFRLATQDAQLRLSEDWAASIVGLLIITIALAACFLGRPAEVDWLVAHKNSVRIREQESQFTISDKEALSDDQVAALAKARKKSTMEKLGINWIAPGQSMLVKVETWGQNPLDAFRKRTMPSDSAGKSQIATIKWTPIVFTLVILGLIGCFGIWLQGHRLSQFLKAIPGLFLLAVFAYLLAAQEVVKYYNFEYPLWALFVGMLVCNTLGTPKWLAPAVCGELYIKIGLILLGGEILLSRLLALGLPGVFVSWLVTPVVLIATYAFGQRVLRIGSRSLNMVISADMSVCGVSAAIATGAACKAKKEELSLAIGLSLAFTAVMMVAMPQFVKWIELPPRIAGAWIGGTIDSTGAVAAAGESLGMVGSETAITVKMIQNILIGVIAFGVAVYWSRWVESSEATYPETAQLVTTRDELTRTSASGVSFREVWIRFPKFVIGFVVASLVCSTIAQHSFFGDCWIQTATLKLTAPIRGWLFCLAFVSIGLSTNFRELVPYLKSGKPLVLYVCGQSLNLVLTLAMAYLMFGLFYEWMAS